MRLVASRGGLVGSQLLVKGQVHLRSSGLEDVLESGHIVHGVGIELPGRLMPAVHLTNSIREGGETGPSSIGILHHLLAVAHAGEGVHKWRVRVHIPKMNIRE